MHNRIRRWFGVLAVGVLVSACGSTAQNRELVGPTFRDGETAVSAGGGDSTAPAEGGEADSAGEGSVALAPDGTPVRAGSRLTGGRGATGAGGGGAGGAGGGGSSVPAGGGGATGSKAPVKVGFSYVKGAEETYKAIGIDLSVGDGVKQTAAIAEWVNANGGLGGHPVELVPAAFTIGGNRTQQAQAACSTWTEDNKVIAAIGATANAVLNACMTQKKVPLIGFTNNPYSAQQWSQFRYVIGAVALAAEVAADATIAHGKSVGYFDATPEDIFPQVALGVVYYDLPEQHRVVKEIIVPQAKAAGATKVVTQAVKYPNTGSEASDTLSQLQNAQLRFRSEQVSHVWILDDGGNLTFNFPQMAESNNYRPRYLFNTFNLVGIEQEFVPKAQLRRSVGMGWAPPGDVSKAKDPGGSDQRKLCDKIFAAKGMSANWGGEAFIAYGYCDDLLLLKRAIDSNGALDGDSIIRTIKSFGSLDSAVTFGQGYGGDKPWSVISVRGFAFDTGCNCFAYNSEPKQVS